MPWFALLQPVQKKTKYLHRRATFVRRHDRYRSCCYGQYSTFTQRKKIAYEICEPNGSNKRTTKMQLQKKARKNKNGLHRISVSKMNAKKQDENATYFFTWNYAARHSIVKTRHRPRKPKKNHSNMIGVDHGASACRVLGYTAYQKKPDIFFLRQIPFFLGSPKTKKKRYNTIAEKVIAFYFVKKSFEEFSKKRRVPRFWFWK